ncbi:MAG: NIPSNAP family protein [Ignavibacteria bacterium]|nr:NIPSNAP family protein [Ignavibacteria bacterium]
MITCHLRYVINPNKLAEFEHYARLWIPLVEKYGGTHHGYFLPREAPPSPAFSFPGIGEEGPTNVAVALFSFPTQAVYETYRQKAAEDPDCQAAAAYYKETKCFLKYERSFMRAVFK